MIFFHDFLGYFLVGASSGAVGFFIAQRQQGMLSDCVSHGALPGVTVFVMLFNSKSPVFISISAMITSFIAMGLCYLIRGRVRPDSAIGAVLGLTLGLNVVLITFSQHLEVQYSASSAFLGSLVPGFIFSEFLWYTTVSLGVFAVLIMFYRSFVYAIFDNGFTSVSFGYNALFSFMTVLLVTLIISLGIMIVGAVMMVSLLIVPTATLSHWIPSYRLLIFSSAMMGGCVCVVSLLLSSACSLPVGAIIAATMCSLFMISTCAAIMRRRGYFIWS